jgi:hypothetical protein
VRKARGGLRDVLVALHGRKIRRRPRWSFGDSWQGFIEGALERSLGVKM